MFSLVALRAAITFPQANGILFCSQPVTLHYILLEFLHNCFGLNWFKQRNFQLEFYSGCHRPQTGSLEETLTRTYI